MERSFVSGSGFFNLYRPYISPTSTLVEKAVDEAAPEASAPVEVEEVEEIATPEETKDYSFTYFNANDYVAKKSPVVEVPTPTPEVTEESNVDNEFNINFGDVNDRSLLFDAQLWTESRYKPESVSQANAKGIAQFMPGTWEWAQEKGWIEKGADPFDVDSSLVAQKRYMEHLYNRGIVQKGETEEEKLKRVLASYNWGIGNVTKAVTRAEQETGDPSNWIQYAPKETTNYIKSIFDRSLKNKNTGFESQFTWYE